MKNLLLMAFLLAGCSVLNESLNLKRSIASLKPQESIDFKLSLSEQTLFANGSNSVFLTVEVSSTQKINPKELALISDAPLKKGEFSAVEDGKFRIKLTPRAKSPFVKMFVTLKDQPSSTIELKTTLSPIKESLHPFKATGNSMIWVSDLTYLRQDYMPEDQYEGFSIDNIGKNSIVSAKDSMRDFIFTFEEQARQNISLMISDAPNGTVSHTMHSYFAFFPRKYLPCAEINSKKEVTVTLPTGEQMMFSETGEVIDGVFEEGPMDNSTDRFKRKYPDLKYQGKGIILRANARGQMPQQGQFESTKIDLEFGAKYSADVLIINGTTGQRCRRPKTDFWPSGDVTPIPFKFPTDIEFDTYLKAKCNFGIPDLEDISPVRTEDHSKAAIGIWNMCFGQTDLKECIQQETNSIEDLFLKIKVEFDLEKRYLIEKKAESLEVSSIISSEIKEIRKTLLSEATWTEKQSCLEKSMSLVKSKLHYHDIQSLIKNELIQNCTSIPAEMESIATFEIKGLQEVIESSFDWAVISDKESFILACQKQALTKLTAQNRYYATPKTYMDSFRSLCIKVESSSAYSAWLETQASSIKEKVLSQALRDLENLAEKRAIGCLAEYPTDTPLNRIRYKRTRDNCLTNDWSSLEAEALKETKDDPIVARLGLDLESIKSELSGESRRIQLKMMKKYFL